MDDSEHNPPPGPLDMYLGRLFWGCDMPVGTNVNPKWLESAYAIVRDKETICQNDEAIAVYLCNLMHIKDFIITKRDDAPQGHSVKYMEKLLISATNCDEITGDDCYRSLNTALNKKWVERIPDYAHGVIVCKLSDSGARSARNRCNLPSFHSPQQKKYTGSSVPSVAEQLDRIAEEQDVAEEQLNPTPASSPSKHNNNSATIADKGARLQSKSDSPSNRSVVINGDYIETYIAAPANIDSPGAIAGNKNDRSVKVSKKSSRKTIKKVENKIKMGKKSALGSLGDESHGAANTGEGGARAAKQLNEKLRPKKKRGSTES